MHHVPDSSLRLRPRRLLPSALLWLAALGCPAGPEGDDLPPGAFTTGGDDAIDPSETEAMTSVDPEGTTTTTSSPDTGSSDDVPPGTVSHDADIQPIWTANCIDASCHDSDGPQGNLDLQSAGVRDRLCSTNSSSQSSIPLVDCEGADSGNSWLWNKVSGDDLDVIPGAGSLMPVGGMLSSDDLATIEAWISGGGLP